MPDISLCPTLQNVVKIYSEFASETGSEPSHRSHEDKTVANFEWIWIYRCPPSLVSLVSEATTSSGAIQKFEIIHVMFHCLWLRNAIFICFLRAGVCNYLVGNLESHVRQQLGRFGAAMCTSHCLNFSNANGSPGWRTSGFCSIENWDGVVDVKVERGRKGERVIKMAFAFAAKFSIYDSIYHCESCVAVGVQQVGGRIQTRLLQFASFLFHIFPMQIWGPIRICYAWTTFICTRIYLVQSIVLVVELLLHRNLMRIVCSCDSNNIQSRENPTEIRT